MKGTIQNGLLICCAGWLMAICQVGVAQTDPPVRLITDADYFFDDGTIRPGFAQIGFEKDALGELPKRGDRDTDVDTMFAYAGARFRCVEPEGHVIVCGFRFKKSISRQRSLGNFYIDTDRGGKKISYQGIMRIDFCVPGNSGSGATVRQAGLFTEIVIPEHTIVEAYNSSGHRIAVTQSTQDRTSFMGFDSSLPIAWLLVRSNEYLQTDRLNRDFAIDDLVFDELVADPERRGVAELLVVRGDGTEDTADAAELGLPGLKWYHGPGALDEKVHELVEGTMVMLSDGSVLRCEAATESFVLAAAPEVTIPAESVAGFWGGHRVAMYPNVAAGMFAGDKAVLVSPLYDIIINSPPLDFADGTTKISLDGAEVLGQFEANAKRLEDNPEHLTDMLAFHGIKDVNEIATNNMLSIWFSPPIQRAEDTGLIRTCIGEEYVLSGDETEAAFALKERNNDGLTISIGDHTIEIPVANIKLFQMPAPR